MRRLSLFQNLVGSTARAAGHGGRRALRCELLERRDLFSVTPITDMTQWAAEFPTHAGPTSLYLNFDGYNAENVQAFSGSGQDIQDILYRTSQIFSPFDVQVRRITGNGNLNTSSYGNSTIFIGDDSDNGTGWQNTSVAYVPWSSADWPGTQRGIFHAPNSDPYDMGFVDPVASVSGQPTETNANIARSVAHEAGHTFGLVHVKSSPHNDIMSYDSLNVAFVNKKFTITIQNNSPAGYYNEPGMQPYSMWTPIPSMPWIMLPVKMVTQNSYSYLSTALGDRSTSGDLANVADTTSVDSAYTDGSSQTLGLFSSLNSTINRPGDYDVFQFTATSTVPVQVGVSRVVGPSGENYLDPVLMVYDAGGGNLLHYNNNQSGSNSDSHLTFTPAPGAKYNIVVGCFNSFGSGKYQVNVTPKYVVVDPPPWRKINPGPFSGNTSATNLGQPYGTDRLGTSPSSHASILGAYSAVNADPARWTSQPPLRLDAAVNRAGRTESLVGTEVAMEPGSQSWDLCVDACLQDGLDDLLPAPSAMLRRVG